MCEYYSDELMHYGVKGMKWGHHKFHNADGSLNSIGKRKLTEKFNKVSKSKIISYVNKNRAINSYRLSKKYSDGKKRIYTHINKRVNKKLDRFNKKVVKKNEKGKYKNLSRVLARAVHNFDSLQVLLSQAKQVLVLFPDRYHLEKQSETIP